MTLSWILLLVGFVLISIGATWLTNGSVAIAQRLRVSEYLIGMTIVAIGTSLPELTVSTASALSGSADMAIGNVVGSNIFNTLLILGICSIFSPIVFSKGNIRIDIPICIVISFILVAMLYHGTLSRIEGLVLLAGYISIVLFSLRTNKNTEIEELGQNKEKFSWVKSIVMIVLGFAGLIYGAKITLDSAVDIARALGVSEHIIAITLLAGGTSLPELAASLIALIKGHGSLALGNVVGSNIANILLILGCCSTITPLTMSGISLIDLLVMAGSVVLLLLSAILYGHRKITRAEGVIFVSAYIGYIWFLIS